jgi:hypothetical protein
MKGISDLFKSIKKSFTLQKKVDFDELNLHFVLEPLTALEELKLLETLQTTEGGIFIAELKRGSLAFALKKINDMEFNNDLIEYEGDEGKTVKESKYLFLKKQIDMWPVALRDLLFEAFNDMHLELDKMVKDKSKFERFNIQTIPENVDKKEPVDKAIPEGFRKIEESKEPENETDKLNQQVKKEEELVESNIAGSLNRESQRILG